MNHRLLLLFPAAIVLAGSAYGAVGCNTVLGNEEGTLRAADAGAVAEGGVDGGAVCDTTHGNKVCYGLCVPINDANTGCGGASCAACDAKNVDSPVCKGGQDTYTCGFANCKAGFGDCDADPTNGCETSLNNKDACGSCTTKCKAPTPFCAAGGSGFGCVNACPPGTTECSGSCVDLQSSKDNCGVCGKKCIQASAQGTCVNGQCSFVCNPGTHLCSSGCMSDIDPNACGPSCEVCPAKYPNTVANCASGHCGLACAPGFLDCDKNPDNGCEYKGTICPVSCTACLATQQCCNGKCVPLDVVCALPPSP